MQPSSQDSHTLLTFDPCRYLDADWLDDVRQYCSHHGQVLQANVAQQSTVQRESLVCSKSVIQLEKTVALSVWWHGVGTICMTKA